MTAPVPPGFFRRLLLATVNGAYAGAIQMLLAAIAAGGLCLAIVPLKVEVPGPTVEVVKEVPVPVSAGAGTPDNAQGWVCDPDAVQAVADTLPVKVFADTPAGQVQDLPPHVYGWKYYEALYARPPPIKDQGQVGSCVSFGTNTAVERTLAAELVARKGGASEWSRFTEEATYGGSRVEIGRGILGIDRGGPNDRHAGSIGAWAAQYVVRKGMVPRQKYDELDLTTYSADRCRAWGNTGVPAWADAVARKFPVKSFTQIKSWDDVKKACAQGYFIAVCSNQGFANRRNANGVAQASGSWAHCMAIDGYHTEGGREYGHIVNSWGTSWISGPVGWGSPGGDGLWAEASVIDRMVKQGDTWAFSGVTGFPARKLDWFIRRDHPKRLQFDLNRDLALAF